MPEAQRQGMTPVKDALLALKGPTGAPAGAASALQSGLCEMELIHGRGTMDRGDPSCWDCREGKLELLPKPVLALLQLRMVEPGGKLPIVGVLFNSSILWK